MDLYNRVTGRNQKKPEPEPQYKNYNSKQDDATKSKGNTEVYYITPNTAHTSPPPYSSAPPYSNAPPYSTSSTYNQTSRHGNEASDDAASDYSGNFHAGSGGGSFHVGSGGGSTGANFDKQKIRELENTVFALTSQISTLKHDHDMATRKITQELEHKQHNIEEENKQAIRTLKATLEENNRRTNDNNRRTIETHERTIKAHERTIETHERTIEENKRALKNQGDKQQELTNLRNEFEISKRALEARLFKKEEEAISLRTEGNSYKQTVERQERTIENQTTKIRQQSDEIATLNEKVKRLDKEHKQKVEYLALSLETSKEKSDALATQLLQSQKEVEQQKQETVDLLRKKDAELNERERVLQSKIEDANLLASEALGRETALQAKIEGAKLLASGALGKSAFAENVHAILSAPESFQPAPAAQYFPQQAVAAQPQAQYAPPLAVSPPLPTQVSSNGTQSQSSQSSRRELASESYRATSQSQSDFQQPAAKPSLQPLPAQYQQGRPKLGVPMKVPLVCAKNLSDLPDI